MQLCERNKCTGCGVCKAVCTHNAITFDIDNLGFRYPIIDATKCVGCGLCVKKCPTLNPVSINTRNDCYLAWAKNDTIHYKSSSGGLAYILSKQIINQGGYIVGCVCDYDFHALKDTQTEEKRNPYGPIFIGDNNWIGQNVIIKKNTTTPKYITMAAGSVISGKYECKEKSILMGNPAVVVAEGKRYMDIKDCFFDKTII